jgi:hypothetical protein
MQTKKTIRLLLIVEILLILFVTTFTYLPNLLKGTIYRDDWYYIVDRMKGGPQTFNQMFSIDRPIRAYFFEAYFRLFGVEPLPYHLATYAWRILLGLATYTFFSLLWPKQRRVALLMTLLFMIYPGYTRWMEGIEDQPKVVSLLLMSISYGLTILALRSSGIWSKAAFWAGAIISGWGYIALVDYAMGMEVFRFLIVMILILRDGQWKGWVQSGLAFTRRASPGFLILGGYLFWYKFLFNNQRPETDITLQLGKVATSPIAGLTNWFIKYVQSVGNSAIVAWGGYAVQDFFKLNSSQILNGLLVSAMITGCVTFVLAWHHKTDPEQKQNSPTNNRGLPWQIEALIIGGLGVLGGAAPVVMANRAIEFGILSHYGLPTSLASATFLVGLFGLISSQRLRVAFVTIVIFIASLTQFAVSTKTVNEEKILSNFWHQVAWRVPTIREATSLLVNYPSVTIGEDVDFVHGPANFIYYPETVNELPVRYKLFALKQYAWTSKEFIAGGKNKDGYRSHYGIIDYSAILVMSQSTPDSCVHVVDQKSPWFSFNDPDSILIVGQHSNIRNVQMKEPGPKLNPNIFGPEPEHGWCYYYEKADLALQQKDLEQVLAIRAEIEKQQLSPAEPLEWMPFLQTYAQLGDEKSFVDTASKMNQSSFARVQVCNVMSNMQENGYSFTPKIQSVITQQLCSQ